MHEAVRRTGATCPRHDDRPSRYRRPHTGHRRRTGAIGLAWEVTYRRTLIAADLVVGCTAAVLALAPHHRTHLLVAALFPLLFVAVQAANGAYQRRHLYLGTEEYQRVIRAGLWLFAAVAITTHATRAPVAPGWLLLVVPGVTVASLATRYAARRVLRRTLGRGLRLRRVLLVGHAPAVTALAARLHRQPAHGMQVVGACLPTATERIAGLACYGTFDDVGQAVATAEADTVIVLGCPELDGVALRRLAWRLERDDVDLLVASSLVDVASARTTIRPVDGVPMVHVAHPRRDGTARLAKALFDRVGAVLLLMLAAPVLLAVAVCLRLTSPGPVLFRQRRTGKDGREFVMYKFRTMYVDAEARLAQLRHLNEHDGVLFKMRNDPRVTPFGRWLRRFSVDELPQLFNVLRGEMSLVGPRPPLPREVAAYPDDMRRRLVVKPGMTGLWQVSGRSDLPWDEAVRLDLRYVENWSLTLDLMILLRTLTAVCRASGAY